MLTILKIIGICILAILAFLLLILLLLLFVPVRYRSTGRLQKKDRQVTAKVSYLASAVSAVVQYRDGNMTWAVKIFGIQILPKKKRGHPAENKHRIDKKNRSGGEKKTAGKSDQNANQGAKQTTEDGLPPAGETKPERKFDHEETANSVENTTTEPESPGKNTAAEPESPGKNTAVEPESSGKSGAAEPENTDDNETESLFGRIFKKIDQFFKGIRERILKIREHIADFGKRIESVRTKLKEYKKQADRWNKFYHFEETQVTLGVLKTELKKLIRYLLPTRIRARIHFGFDDPADTGITLGAISTVYGFFPKGIDLEPDFAEKVLEGEWKLRGRIRLIYFIRLALRLLLKKENRVTYRRMRKLMAQSGR